MKRYTYLHSYTRYTEWVVFADSEEEAFRLLFDEDHSYLAAEWTRNDEIESRGVEDISDEEYQQIKEALSK